MRGFYLPLGPISILVIGRVWALDIMRLRIWGIGWRLRLMLLRPE